MKSLRVILFLLFALSTQALSDARPDPNPAGSVLEPEGATKVQMVHERVLFEISPVSQKAESPDLARVTADFYFRNRGTALEKMQVLFPVGTVLEDGFNDHFYVGKNLKVWVDGTALPTTELHKKDGDTEYKWQAFQVSFPVEKEVFVRVQYDTYSLGLSDRNLNSFGYTFATGAPWFGKIEDIQLVLRMPYQVSRENTWNSNLFGQAVKPAYLGNEAIWHWQNIEPTTDPYLEFQTIPIWLWKNHLAALSEVKSNPKNIKAHRSLIDSILQMNNWGYSIFPGESWHDPRLEKACLNAFRQFPQDVPIRLYCIDKASAQITKDGEGETNPEAQFMLRTFAEIQKISPYNPKAEEAYTKLQTEYDQLWMTLPLQPPRPNSRGASTSITAIQTVQAIAQNAKLQPRTVASCKGFVIETESYQRLLTYKNNISYDYKLEQSYAFQSQRKQTLTTAKVSLDQALQEFGRSWNTPMWGKLKAWQLRWFANLDGSRRYVVALKTLPDQTTSVCVQTYLRYVVKN
jgi:hypothetical protein